jgi:hypothetical protein
MPTAPLRPCAKSSCSNLVVHGYCVEHQRQLGQRRGTFTQRGYGIHWVRFVAWWKQYLVSEFGRPAICGAAFPGGPETLPYSQCRQRGLLTGTNLHLDHEPPLTSAERQAAVRGDRSAVDNPLRVALLCAACHSAKTQKETGRMLSY